MAILSEAATSIYGAYRLAHFDPGGMTYFDTSERGFWHSFYAAVIVAPFYALLLAVSFPTLRPAPDPLPFAVTESIAYVIAWTAFPLVMAAVTRRLARWDRFIGYIVAYNWASVVQNAVFIPVNLAWSAGLVGGDAGFLMWLIAVLLILAYSWFIARTALALTPLGAAGIVVLDVTLNLLISFFARQIA